MSAPPPEFEETEVGRDAHPAGLQAALLVALLAVVAAAVIAGILLVWGAIQPVLPPAPAPVASTTAALG
ncbi:hypothetical protein [Naasia sp. SYSU D00948]|uniref:hypothetical protein n=1 Tax=Naasia sp. SYSU D00948 TaxID=2817379 RepID=UPI001B3143B7|nr:hypothetical protein [Naasia sp. SYSU D00948]